MNAVILIHYYITFFFLNIYLVCVWYKNIVTECGQLFVETKLSNVNGERSKYGSAPWNIGVYKNNTETNEYDIICGGSLISSKLVISGEFSVHSKCILSEEFSTMIYFFSCPMFLG